MSTIIRRALFLDVQDLGADLDARDENGAAAVHHAAFEDAADAIAAMGHIDILVNNAGGGSGPGANVGGIFDRSNVRPALRTAGGCPDAPLGRSVRLSHGRRRWRR